MTNIPDSCLSSGPFGSLILTPSEFQILSGSTQSELINIEFQPSEQYFQAPSEIICVIEFRNKQQNQNLITNIQPILDDNSKLRFNYIELQPGRFQISLRTSEFSPNTSTVFSFKISVPISREEIRCSIIDIDALSSGFGSVYNYFKIHAALPITPTTGSISGETDPPPPRLSVEKILNVDSFYSFYNEAYENLILTSSQGSRNLSSELLSENMLPNINLLSFLGLNSRQINKKFLNEQLNADLAFDLLGDSFTDFTSSNNYNVLTTLASLGGLINGEKSLNFTGNSINSNKKVFFDKSYFDELTEDVIEIFKNENSRDALLTTPYQSTKTYLFNSKYEKVLYPVINSAKELFPMYTHVYVDSDLVRNVEKTVLSNDISVSSDKEIIIKNINLQKSRFFTNSNTKNLFNKFLQERGLLDYFYYCFVNDVSRINTTLQQFVEKYFSSDSNISYESLIQNNDIFYIGDFDFIELGKNNINNVLLKSKIYDNDYTNSLDQQILCYKIEKWRVDDPNLQALKTEIDRSVFENTSLVIPNNIKPLESYYIINNFENNFLQFIDSQVKFGKEYEYIIYKYYLKTRESDNALEVRTQFVESVTTKINDDPPILPSLQILPFKNVDTEFLMYFTANSGRYFDNPIAITNEDNQEINLMLSSSLKNKEGKVQFEGDDLVNSYELFRIEVEPKSYSDFSNSDISIIESSENGSAVSIETVQPNKKYYYTARSRDVHNKFSNPIPVIEVELINESGAIYLRKRIIDFKEFKFEMSKSFDKFIQIKPSERQLQNLSNNRTAFDTNSLNPGPDGTKVWNKNYVLRLTSKVTGKKIDIKFNFNYNLRN